MPSRGGEGGIRIAWDPTIEKPDDASFDVDYYLFRTRKNAQTVATKTSQKQAGWQIRGKQLGVISGERNFMIQRQISDA